MSAIRTNAAAAMLGVSPNTLRSWERRFGFPSPRRSPGGHRQYELAEVEALRGALEETQNVSSAVSVARERGAGPSSPLRLRSLLGRFDEPAADRVLEESLAVRSVERTVEEVLLPGVAAVGAERERDAPEYGFAWRWAAGWMAAQLRTAPPASRGAGVLVLDATRPLDLDGLHAAALELVLRRAGLRTLALPVEVDPVRLGRALSALAPGAVVLTGRGAPVELLARLVHAVRRAGARGGADVRAAAAPAVLDFRGALPAAGASTVPALPDRPLAARDALLGVIEERTTPGARAAR